MASRRICVKAEGCTGRVGAARTTQARFAAPTTGYRNIIDAVNWVGPLLLNHDPADRRLSQSLHGIATTVTLSQARVDALHPKVDAIHDSVTASAAQMQHVVQRMDPIAEAVSRVEESSKRIEVLAHSLHQLLLSGGSGASVHVTAATRVEQREAVSSFLLCGPIVSLGADTSFCTGGYLLEEARTIPFRPPKRSRSCVHNACRTASFRPRKTVSSP
jgi:hypothetical protein